MGVGCIGMGGGGLGGIRVEALQTKTGQTRALHRVYAEGGGGESRHKWCWGGGVLVQVVTWAPASGIMGSSPCTAAISGCVRTVCGSTGTQ